jgi:hypothetical protein
MVVIAQHFLTISARNMVVSSNASEATSSYHVQWQVCGSGTRFPWEWVAVIILAVILAALLLGYIEGLVAN